MTSPVLSLLKDLTRWLRWRGVVIAMVMVVNGFTAGLGATLLFPLLSTLGVGKGMANGGMGGLVAEVLRVIGPAPQLTTMIGVIVAAFLVQSGVALCEGWLTSRTRTAYVARWRTELFRTLFDARWQFFTQRKTGQLLNVLLTETTRVGGALQLIGLAVAGVVFILVYLVVAFVASWKVALGITAVGIVMSIVVRPMIRSAQRMGREATQLNESMHVMAAEFLGGAKLIKATASEDRAMELFTSLVRRTWNVERLTAFHPSLIRLIYEIGAVMVLGVSLWAGIVVMDVDPAAILVIVFLFLRIYLRLSDVQQCIQNLNANFAPAIVPLLRTLADARAEAEPATPPGAAGRPASSRRAGAALLLRDVCVSHQQHPVLRDISLDIPAGAVIGIAGPSGAGKSTLVDCILGLASIDRGILSIDGSALTAQSLRAWRKDVGYVAQDTFLFNASVADNIRWSNPDASSKEIEDAATRAHADDFIRVLPRGFQTEVGDRGVRLSGGQRQRIGLARALAGNIRLLVLDEATSALDSESEQAVLDAIAELRGQMTVIMIAHRLSTLRVADRICLLEDGRIVEFGTWDELIRPGTRFQDFWKLQSVDDV